jgi:hypothetical protein
MELEEYEASYPSELGEELACFVEPELPLISEDGSRRFVKVLTRNGS